MNTTLLFLLLQFSALMPLSAALVRIRKIDPSYYPFLLWIFLGLVNESLNFILIKLVGSNAVSFNIFHIIEALLITYQLMVWGFLKSRPSYLYWVSVAFVITWTVENLLFNKIFEFSPFFRIFYAFALVLIIVNEIFYIARETSNLFTNAKFIICTGLILLFVYQILFEGALMVSTTKSTINYIISIFIFMNASLNAIYAWGILVMKKKSNMTLESNNEAYEFADQAL
jgi:hypothetical protein